MKVWQFDPAQITAYYNYALCDALSDAGADVTYFTSHYIYDDVIVPDTFKTEYIYFRGMDSQILRRSARLRKLLRGLTYPLGHLEAVQRARRAHPDIVHLQWSRLPRFDQPFIRAMRRQGAKIVHTVHDVVPLFEHPSNRYPIGEIYGLCDALIVHAEANRQDLLTTFPDLRSQSIFVVPHVSLQSMFPVPDGGSRTDARDYLRKTIGIPSDSMIFMLFGNLKSYKGIDLLLQAWEQFAKGTSDANLVLIGKREGSMQAMSMPGVHWLPGYVPTQEVWRYMLGADVVVFPYRHIYQSGAMITAMGYGSPVIATEVGALPENVDGNGWIVPPTAEALAQAITDAAVRRNELPSMGQRSLDIIQTRHAPAVVGERLMDVYRTLLV